VRAGLALQPRRAAAARRALEVGGRRSRQQRAAAAGARRDLHRHRQRLARRARGATEGGPARAFGGGGARLGQRGRSEHEGGRGRVARPGRCGAQLLRVAHAPSPVDHGRQHGDGNLEASGGSARPMMMKNLIAAALLALSTVAYAAGGGAMAPLKQKNGEGDKLLRQKGEKGKLAEQKQKDDIKKLAATLLDYDELAQKSLAAHWDKLTPAQRTEFVTTLRELIERNYVKQLRSNLDYQVQYKNEEADGEQATVSTVVKVKSPG